jgi:hypothetical protein
MAKSVVHDLTSSENIRKAKEIINETSSTMRDDVIYYVSPEMLGNANYMMQSMVMAHPDIYQMYQQGILDGYSHSLVIDEGSQDIIYANVTSGWTTSDSVVKTDAQHYVDSSALHFDEYDANNIIKTWRNAMYAIANDIDPTHIEQPRI